MILESRKCHNCESVNIVRNGKNACGQQRYQCKDCGVTRVLDSVQKSRTLDMDQVAQTYQERNSYRSTGRIFGVSNTTVARWLKKKAQDLPTFKSTIAPAEANSILEVDEVFTFVLLRVAQVRIWIAQCRQSRQIVSFFIGDGSMDSCKRMWRKLPYSYLRCNSFSDFWRSYNCIPKDTHQLVGKETGETNHVERLNNTIRQTFSRMVRKALSFSKKMYMLNLHFKLWAYHYNLHRAGSIPKTAVN